MKKAKKVDLITIEGGENRGNPCHTGYHQFLGIEAAVTKQIADWIKRYQSIAKADSGSYLDCVQLNNRKCGCSGHVIVCNTAVNVASAGV